MLFLCGETGFLMSGLLSLYFISKEFLKQSKSAFCRKGKSLKIEAEIYNALIQRNNAYSIRYQQKSIVYDTKEDNYKKFKELH